MKNNINQFEESSMSKSLDDHLKMIRTKIIQRTYELTDTDKNTEPNIPDLAKAIEEFAPGHVIVTNVQIEQKKGFFDFFPPVALLSAILAFVFATLGLWAILGADEAKINGQGFLDIAKIFAGAIVGSATSVAVGASRKK